MTSTGPGEIWQAIELNQDYLPIFGNHWRHCVPIEYHVHIWQVFNMNVIQENLKRNKNAKLKKGH